jgi:hypothetical protein
MAVKAQKVHRTYPKPCCPVCFRPLKPAEMKSGTIFCKGCGKNFEAVVFVPPPETIAVRGIVATGTADEPGGSGAPCARHALNAADSNCERCGNFMCALCRIDLAGKTYCPACFERILEQGTEELPAEREFHSRGIASLAAVSGFLIPFFGALMGPVGVVYSIKAFRDARRGKKVAGNAGGIVLILLLALFDTVYGAVASAWAGYWIYRSFTNTM